MTAARPATCAAAICALMLTACATPPPKGLAPPAAIDGQKGGGGELSVPPDGRLVAFRVSVETPPEELLDEQDAGVLTLRREGVRDPIRLVFLNGALGVYALRSGIYRVDTIAGYHCGELYLLVAPKDEPVALGGLELAVYDEAEAELAGRLPTLEDIERIASLTGADTPAVDAEPLERRSGIACTRRPRAVSRPDVDPTIRKLTPAEIAGTVVLVGLLGAATGGAAATGSIVFVSGSAGGVLLLSL